MMDARLGVMQVVHSLCMGGSERLACDLATRPSRDRLRPSLCALDVGGPLGEELAGAGVPFWVLDRRPGFDWRLVPRIWRLVQRQRARVVQTHHLTPLIYAALAARLAGARIVHVEHEQFTLQRPKALGRLRRLTRLCDHVVAAGAGVGRFLTECGGLDPGRLTVIENGVDVAAYSPAPRVPRAAWGIGDDRVVGHVARLEHEKDQDTLLRAFRVVVDRCARARLMIIGTGTLRAPLEEQAGALGIADRVTFLGARADVRDFLPHADVFALSSTSEGLPLTVLEAMACARPVVATAVGEVPRAVVPGVTGVLVPPKEPAALADALLGVLCDPARARAMGRAGREKVQAEFSIERTVSEYQKLWNRVETGGGNG
jgi:glycosyltransferase involved in cell wall biosynthesis